MRRRTLVCIVLALLVACAPSLAKIDVNHDNSPPRGPWTEKYWSGDFCNCACLCFTVALPLEWTGPPDAGFDAVLGASCPGWTVGTRTEFGGTLNILNYESYTCQARVGGSWPFTAVNNVHCRHGVELVMNYAPGAGEPAINSIRFVQRFTTMGFGCGDVGPADVIDGDGVPDNPYYPTWQNNFPSPPWPAGRRWFVDAPESGCATVDPLNNRNWTSHCGEEICPQPCGWITSIYTYLANPISGEQSRLAMHDGVHWGLVAGCVPGPNSRLWGPLAGFNPGTAIHYDVVTGTLSIEDAVIDVLNLTGQDVMDPAFANDPMLGATISIDDFSLLLTTDDTYVFQGGKYRITKDGNTFLEADIPFLVIDDDAMAQFLDNIFGDLINLTFDQGLGSAWLQDYQDYLTTTGRHPEFRSRSTNPLEPLLGSGESFDDTGYVWTSVCVPEPASFLPLAVGLIGMIGVAVRRRRQPPV